MSWRCDRGRGTDWVFFKVKSLTCVSPCCRMAQNLCHARWAHTNEVCVCVCVSLSDWENETEEETFCRSDCLHERICPTSPQKTTPLTQTLTVSQHVILYIKLKCILCIFRNSGRSEQRTVVYSKTLWLKDKPQNKAGYKKESYPL